MKLMTHERWMYMFFLGMRCNSKQACARCSSWTQTRFWRSTSRAIEEWWFKWQGVKQIVTFLKPWIGFPEFSSRLVKKVLQWNSDKRIFQIISDEVVWLLGFLIWELLSRRHFSSWRMWGSLERAVKQSTVWLVLWYKNSYILHTKTHNTTPSIRLVNISISSCSCCRWFWGQTSHA